jgi:hypothetical protein
LGQVALAVVTEGNHRAQGVGHLADQPLPGVG